MPDPVSLPHPQKLYASLRALASAELRSRAVFDFVCAATGAESGYLFLARGPKLECVAASHGSAASPGLIQEVSSAWDHELDREPDDNMNKTLDVSTIEALRRAKPPLPPANSQSSAFERRMLSIYRGARWVPVGVAVLKAREARPLTPIRQVHVAAVCNALLDAGDVVESAPEAEARSS